MRMVPWRHRGTADLGAKPHVAGATGFAELDIAVFNVANLSDGCAAFLQNQANFAGGHTHMRVFAFFGEQLGGGASGATNLGAFLAPYADEALERSLEILAQAPTFRSGTTSWITCTMSADARTSSMKDWGNRATVTRSSPRP